MAKSVSRQIFGKKKKTGLLTSGDIMKGFTRMATLYDIWTLAPVQCLPVEEKTEDWIKWNADWFENIALRELPKKSARLQKLYNMAQGVINKSDYIYNPNGNTSDLSNHLGIIGVKDNEQDLMNQFFPIIPNVINVFLGEKLRRDNKVIVDAIDPESINEGLEFKMNKLRDILTQDALTKKQMQLMQMGLVPSEEMAPEQKQMYMQEMESAKKLSELETQFKKFRTVGAQWGQHFIEKYTAKHYFDEMDLEMFADSLIADEAIIALNLYDDDFKPEVLQPMKTYVNISPSKKYYDESNFIVHIDFMSLSDIINKFRNKLTEEQVLSLENQFNNRFTKDILLNTETRTSDYWQTDKTYEYNMDVSANVREHLSERSIENFVKDTLSGTSLHTYTNNFNNPKMIRVSRIWWPSQRRVGLLTRINEDTGVPETHQIDEYYQITEKPVYNETLLKEKSARTLVKGEHVEWKWAIEWRHVTKIGENRPYYTVYSNAEYENIYIGGEPIKFQFKGDLNIWDARPPVIGCRFSNRNSFKSSLVERMRPWQIMYNVANNRVARTLPFDYGKILVTNKSGIARNSLFKEDGVEPLFEYLDSLRETKVSLHDDTIENMEGRTGRQIEPRVLDMSMVEQATLYLQMGILFKQQAFESIGISQERLSQIQASTSATGVQQAVEGSVNQTEIYFDSFMNKFMPRVYEMILNAGQFYTVMSEEFSDTYINKNLEKVFFSITKNDLLLRDLIIMPVTSGPTKTMMQEIKRLAMEDNTMGMRFIEKAKTIVSTNPSEVFEALEKAEYQRIQEEEAERQHEMQLQQQRDEAMRQLELEKQAKEDERFYAKLQNDKDIAAIRSMGYPDGQNDTDQNSVADVLEIDKFQMQSQMQQANLDLQKQKMNNDALNSQQKMQLEREKMQMQREKMANDLAVAQENKQQADVQFQQLRKDKKEQAAKQAAKKKS